MKKRTVFGVSFLLVLLLAGMTIGSAMAQEEGVRYERLTTPISVDAATQGDRPVSLGSTIYHLENGTTKIFSPDKKLALTVKDSEAFLVSTPKGRMPATQVYDVPNGAFVEGKGKVTRIYDSIKRETLLLTIIDQRNELIVPDFDGWIEQTNDWTVDVLGHFYGEWYVPSDPPAPANDAVDFLFTAVEPDDGSAIIQPVLEWNQAGSGRWTGAAWAVWNGGSARSTAINANAGNKIIGNMYNFYGEWYVYFRNDTTSQATALFSDKVPFADVAVFTTLEGYNIVDDDDVPGDTTFDCMYFKDDWNGNNVDITWNDDISGGTGLTGLAVTIYSDAKVKLSTAN